MLTKEEVVHEFSMMDLEKLMKDTSEERYIYVISNRMDTTSPEVRDDIYSNVVTMITTTKIDIYARCHRGCTEGNYLIGKTCRTCNTVVQHEDEEYRPNVWYTIDSEDEDDYRFIHPYFYVSLASFFKEHKIDFLKYISGKYVRDNVKYQELDSILKQCQIEVFENTMSKEDAEENINNITKPVKSLEWFKEYWELYLGSLAQLPQYGQLENLIYYIKQREDILRPRCLPLPPRRIITVEKSKSKKPATLKISKSIRKLIGIFNAASNSNKFRELDHINVEVANLWSSMGTKNEGIISSKQGLVRHNLNSTSEIYGIRCPITLLNGLDKSKWNEIHAPYSSMVAILRYHIINILARKHNKPIHTFRARLDAAVRNFDQEIYDVMENQIVKASPNGRGLEVMFQRNPSQGSQAMQDVFISHIKKDVAITTISASDVTVEYMNADIDGDELHVTFKMYESDDLSTICPSTDIFGIAKNPGDMFGKSQIDPLLGANISKQILDEEVMYNVIDA